MSLIRETCGCGAEWEGESHYRAEADKFREAHAVCRRETVGEHERCICVKDRLGNPMGFDSSDPIVAKPCPVHSPEYREVQ